MIRNGLTPIHPGEYLAEILKELHTSAAFFARGIGVPPMHNALFHRRGRKAPQLGTPNVRQQIRLFATFTIAIVAAFAVSNSAAKQSSPFQGAWEHYDSYRGTQYCSSYVLLQNGRNVCGSRGSETQTECSEEGTPQDAWESANGSLYLVGGGLDENAKVNL